MYYHKSSILYLFLAPALGGFLFGYDIGGTSYAILQLASLDANLPLSLNTKPLKTGWFVSAPSAGALLGTAILVYMEQTGSSQHSRNNSSRNSNSNNNKFKSSKQWLSPIGRKTELLVAGVLYALGGSLQYLACLKWMPFCFQVVCVGRWIYGAGIGFAMHGGPTYLAETVPPSVRGMVVGAKEIAIVLGILTGYIVGNNLCTGTALDNENENNNNGWAKVYGLTVLGAISMICFSKTIPESARYLVSANHVRATRDTLTNEEMNDEEIDTQVQQLISSEVLESLRYVWTPKRAQEEHSKLMEIYAKQLSNKQETIKSLKHLVSDPNIRPALTAGLGLVVLQQITGQPSVLSYATPILANVPGLGSSASILLALFKVLATSVSVVLVEKNGRKTLLKIGCALMLVALMVLAIAFSTSDTSTTSLDASSIFALAGMFAYIAGYQVGFGPITWLMISEVFPQHVRGTTVALAVQANFALNALVQFLVPILQTTLGMSWTFCIFGCLTAYSLWFVQRCVPETKGLTLEEIEEKLKRMVAVKTGNNKKKDPSTVQKDDDDDERIHLLP